MVIFMSENNLLFHVFNQLNFKKKQTSSSIILEAQTKFKTSFSSTFAEKGRHYNYDQLNSYFESNPSLFGKNLLFKNKSIDLDIFKNKKDTNKLDYYYAKK